MTRTEADALLAYTDAELVRLNLGDSETNCSGVVAVVVDADGEEPGDNEYAADYAGFGVRLYDGVGLDAAAFTHDGIDAELAEMAAYFAESDAK